MQRLGGLARWEEREEFTARTEKRIPCRVTSFSNTTIRSYIGI